MRKPSITIHPVPSDAPAWTCNHDLDANVELHITLPQAEALWAILRNIGGDPKTTARGHTDAILELLTNANIGRNLPPYNTDDASGAYGGTVYAYKIQGMLAHVQGRSFFREFEPLP